MDGRHCVGRVRDAADQRIDERAKDGRGAESLDVTWTSSLVTRPDNDRKRVTVDAARLPDT